MALAAIAGDKTLAELDRPFRRGGTYGACERRQTDKKSYKGLHEPAGPPGGPGRGRDSLAVRTGSFFHAAMCIWTLWNPLKEFKR